MIVGDDDSGYKYEDDDEDEYDEYEYDDDAFNGINTMMIILVMMMYQHWS
jgi:hypothetical protein